MFLCSVFGWSGLDAPFDPGRVPFIVKVKGISHNYRVLAVFVLPAESVKLELPEDVFPDPASEPLQRKGENVIVWNAPLEPGLYPLRLSNPEGRAMVLNFFIMRPAADVENGVLGDYRIGEYPSTPLRGLATYDAPKGFVQVTPQLLDTQVSPHFTLGQFLCKQETKGETKYMLLRTALLLKLEFILQEVNKAGIRTDSFIVMSGFRTPHYNKSIGNRPNSRHVYGGAADIFIDVSPKDGVMDDLNKDGKVNRADATFLYDLVDQLSHGKNWSHVGGLGEYGSNGLHGPFIHVDARGYKARWGKSE